MWIVKITLQPRLQHNYLWYISSPVEAMEDIYGGRKINIYISAGHWLPNTVHRGDFLPDGPVHPPYNLSCQVVKHRNLFSRLCFQHIQVYATPPNKVYTLRALPSNKRSMLFKWWLLSTYWKDTLLYLNVKSKSPKTHISFGGEWELF